MGELVRYRSIAHGDLTLDLNCLALRANCSGTNYYQMRYFKSLYFSLYCHSYSVNTNRSLFSVFHWMIIINRSECKYAQTFYLIYVDDHQIGWPISSTSPHIIISIEKHVYFVLIQFLEILLTFIRRIRALWFNICETFGRIWLQHPSQWDDSKYYAIWVNHTTITVLIGEGGKNASWN